MEQLQGEETINDSEFFEQETTEEEVDKSNEDIYDPKTGKKWSELAKETKIESKKKATKLNKKSAEAEAKDQLLEQVLEDNALMKAKVEDKAEIDKLREVAEEEGMSLTELLSSPRLSKLALAEVEQMRKDARVEEATAEDGNSTTGSPESTTKDAKYYVAKGTPLSEVPARYKAQYIQELSKQRDASRRSASYLNG